jgi:hypothetical protein
MIMTLVSLYKVIYFFMIWGVYAPFLETSNNQQLESLGYFSITRSESLLCRCVPLPIPFKKKDDFPLPGWITIVKSQPFDQTPS